MHYQISDHFDGDVFFNPEPTIRNPASRPRSGMLKMLWKRWRKQPSDYAIWPDHIENTAYKAPEETPPPTITWIGHSSFLVRLPGLSFLTDPVFSQRCSPSQSIGPKRVRDPGLRIDQLPHIDLILLSHNHYDHMDILALRQIRARFPGCKIVTSLGNTAYLARKGLPGAVELDWWESFGFKETKITATPARHFAARSLWDRNKTLWCGFMLEHQGQKLYFGGDSGYTKFFAEIAARLGSPDLAFIPIGAYEPRWFMGPVHLNPADAVQAFQDLGAKRAVGMHFGTFQLTAEAIDAPLLDLAAALEAAGIGAETFFTLDVGQTVPIPGQNLVAEPPYQLHPGVAP
jgi:L-ascorbate metabolism protein UlaG (beta-lactamase superfamily)